MKNGQMISSKSLWKLLAAVVLLAIFVLNFPLLDWSQPERTKERLASQFKELDSEPRFSLKFNTVPVTHSFKIPDLSQGFFNSMQINSFGDIGFNSSSKKRLSIQLKAVIEESRGENINELLDTISEESKRFDIDPCFVLAVMRGIKSSRVTMKNEAENQQIGIIDLKPSQAFQLGKFLGLSLNSFAELEDSNIGLKLVVRYLSVLRELFNGSSNLVALAYLIGDDAVYKKLQFENAFNSEELDFIFLTLSYYKSCRILD